MDGPRDYYNKLSKSNRERQISYDITHMRNLIKRMQNNLFTKQKQTHRFQHQTYGYPRGNVGERYNWEVGIGTYSACLCVGFL